VIGKLAQKTASEPAIGLVQLPHLPLIALQ
jgi:hypothetical protein